MSQIKTQGTHIYFVDSTGSEAVLHKLTCPTAASGLGSGSTDEIDTTCLDSSVKTFTLGLSDSGEISIPYNLDLTDNSHLALYDVYNSKVATPFCIALSDGTEAPTLDSNGDIVAPSDRSSFIFSGLVKMPATDIATNEILRNTMSVRVSGAVTLTTKAGVVKTIS